MSCQVWDVEEEEEEEEGVSGKVLQKVGRSVDLG